MAIADVTLSWDLVSQYNDCVNNCAMIKRMTLACIECLTEMQGNDGFGVVFSAEEQANVTAMLSECNSVKAIVDPA